MIKVGAFIFVFLGFMGCEYANDQAVVGEKKSGGAHGGSPGGGSDENQDINWIPSAAGGNQVASIAATATAAIGYRICTKPPHPRVKCAEQASRVLKAAGVPIKGSWGVNDLVSQLRAQGWRPGPCAPGAVKHSAGPSASGRHVGVIGQDGRAVHNSGSRDPNCGVMGTGNYPAWNKPGGSECLVHPQFKGKGG